MVTRHEPAAKIVVGTDGSATATAALRRAVQLAAMQGAMLHVVTAYRPKMSRESARASVSMPDDQRWQISPGEVAERTARAAAEAGVAAGLDVECHTHAGDPADVLVDVVAEVGADLLVIGNKGMRGAGRMVIPSVPNRLSHRARCDVLLVDTTTAVNDRQLPISETVGELPLTRDRD